MTVLSDVFAPDGFGVYSLTAAIDKMPHAPTLIRDMKLFREIPMNTTHAAIEEHQGVLALIPTTARGGPGIPGHDGDRVVRSFKVPHIQVDDTVLADDVINTRSFGSQDAMSGTGEVVARKLETMKRSVDVTNEFCRRGAINGKIFYPEDSIDADLDIYEQFGLTNQATQDALTQVDFLWGTDTKLLVGGIIRDIRYAIEDALGGTPYSGIVCLCGKTFFGRLINQGTITDMYKQVLAQHALQAVQMQPGQMNRQSITIDGVTFMEYYGQVGTSDGVGTDGYIQQLATARAFPVGADIFHSYVAPADLSEAAGTMGKPMYARQYPSIDGKRQNLEVQSNMLHICTRPGALIHCKSST